MTWPLRETGIGGRTPTSDQIILEALGFAVCAGLFFAVWPCFADIAEGKGRFVLGTGHITPAAFYCIFILGAFLTALLLVPALCRKPLDKGEPLVFWSSYCSIPLRGHVLGISGGLAQGLGTLLTLLASEVVGGAVSMSITRCSPVVAALWGLLLWDEMEGADRKAGILFVAMVVFFLTAVLLLSLAGILEAKQ